MSAHVRYPSRESVLDALLRMGVAHGAPAAVWPPHRLPHGLLVSPVRNGWVSVWSPLENLREWFPQLAATLECPGLILEVVQSRFWIAEFLQDGDFLGRIELPTEAAEYDDLWARTVESLEAEGVDQPWDDEARFGSRLDEIAQSQEYLDDLEHVREERPEPEDLQAFVPPHGHLDRAWELLTAIDRDEEDVESPSADPLYAEEYMESFASYLGIRDAAWNFRDDLDTITNGDYDDDEGLPEDWREFVVLPLTQLPVL